MDWLKGNWLKALLLVFAVAGWVAHQELEAMEGIKHRKDACVENCIKKCHLGCAANNTPLNECNCDWCYRECGY